MKTQETTTKQDSKQLESEGNMFMKAPAFGLTAGGESPSDGTPIQRQEVEGGGDEKKSVRRGAQGEGYTLSVTPESNPFQTIPIAFPGQLAWVHSPCFSQELEAVALEAAAGGDFQSAASTISSTILALQSTPFRNAEGKQNDWAKRMMKDSVLMNPQNMAATVTGTGFPKLVILTFWNDPSNPETGGVNYGYFIEISWDMLPKELRKDEGGGMIIMGEGDNNKLDLGHFSEKVVEINEWMAMALDFMKACQSGARPNPADLPDNMPAQIKHLLEQAKKGYDAAEKGEKTIHEYQVNENEKDAKERYEKDKFVTINGEKLEKDKRYAMSFQIDGKDVSGHKSPAEFLKEWGTQYGLGKCKKLLFKPL